MRQIVGNDRPNLLFTSRLVWEKNLETLIRIYENAEAKNLNYNFIVAGDGVAKNAVMQAMPKAHFTGHVAVALEVWFKMAIMVFLVLLKMKWLI